MERTQTGERRGCGGRWGGDDGAVVGGDHPLLYTRSYPPTAAGRQGRTGHGGSGLTGWLCRTRRGGGVSPCVLRFLSYSRFLLFVFYRAGYAPPPRVLNTERCTLPASGDR